MIGAKRNPWKQSLGPSRLTRSFILLQPFSLVSNGFPPAACPAGSRVTTTRAGAWAQVRGVAGISCVNFFLKILWTYVRNLSHYSLQVERNHNASLYYYFVLRLAKTCV